MIGLKGMDIYRITNLCSDFQIDRLHLLRFANETEIYQEMTTGILTQIEESLPHLEVVWHPLPKEEILNYPHLLSHSISIITRELDLESEVFVNICFGSTLFIALDSGRRYLLRVPQRASMGPGLTCPG